MPERSDRRLTLFLRAPHFRLLFAATAGSAIGTYLTATVLTLRIFDLTRSGTWIAALLVADFLPIVAIGLTLGPLVDRLSRKRLMVAADLARFAVFCALPFVDRPAAIVGLAAVAGIATGFFRPAVYAGLPNLVDGDDELTEANSLLGGVENAAWMVGPVLASLLYAAAGAKPAYVVNAVTFLFSALLVSRIPARRLQSEESLSRGHWRDVADGIGFVLRSPQLRTVLVVWNVVIAGNAALNVAEVVFAKSSLGAGNVGYGGLVAATGVGLTAGSLLTPLVIGRVGLRRLYPAAIALMGLGAVAASTAPSIWVAAPLAAVATLGNGAAIICNQLLVQRGAPDALRGRALAVLMSSTYLTLALAMAATGPLTNAFGGRTLWAAAGSVYLFGSVVALAMSRSLRRAVAEPARPREAPAAAAATAGNGDEAGQRGDERRPLERLRTLLEEVERTHRAEAERSVSKGTAV